MNKSASKGTTVLLQSAATTGSGTTLAIPGVFTQHEFLVQTEDLTYSAGKLLLESSGDPSFAGTWVVLATEITLAANKVLRFAITGPLSFIRARISETITGGGTVTVYYRGTN